MTRYFRNYIPTYSELKSLDKSYEYVYEIAHIVGTARLRLTYNEEHNGKISIDYLEGGFLHSLYLPIRNKTDIIENQFYNLNKNNYKKIIDFIIIVKQQMLEELNDIKWG